MAKNLTTGLQRGLRQSIAGGLGTGDLFSTASLDLQFARHKSLDSRVTHTRQSSATYVDGDGVIRTAVTNLLLQSEDFSTTWTTNGTCSVSPDQAVAPNGELTADEITVNNGLANHITQPASITSGTTYTLSAYVKAGTISSITLRTAITGSDGYIVYAFATDSISIATPALISSASSVSLGNGWHRLSMQYTPTVSGTAGIRMGGGNTNNGTFYLWGAQLEESSTVGQYVKTTTAKNGAPRFDHDPTTGESLGLLVEESRENLLLQSEDFSTTWSESDASVSANQTIAPDGNATADKLVCGTGTPLFQGVVQSITATSSATRFSVYVKAAELDQIELRSFSPTNLAVFELSTQQVLSQSGSPDPTITDAGNGWYRCSITSSSSGVTSFRISLASGGSRTFTPILGAGLYLWGAQLEAGSFPTSYIPTEGSTVTRAADVTSITGTNFSSWYNNSEGTVFAEVTPLQTSAGNQFIWRVSANDYGNTVFLNQTGSGIYSFGSSSGGVFDGITSSSAYTLNQKARLAGGYKSNDLALSFSGSNVSTDSSATIPLSVNRLNIGSDHLGANQNKLTTIRRLTYWPTRLSNDTLQTITR